MAYRVCLIFLIVTSLGTTLIAQSDHPAIRVEAENLLSEGLQLSKDGSKASLELAVRKFEKAQALFHTANDAFNEATALNNIGSIYGLLGMPEKVLDYYLRALSLRQAIRDRRGEANTLRNIGGFYRDAGNKVKALDYFEQAVTLFGALGDVRSEANLLTRIGGAHHDLGEKQQALDYLVRALPLYREISDREGEAGAINNIGGIYGELGETKKALEYLLQVLPLYRALGDRHAETRTLRNIGAIYDDLNDKPKALLYYTQALPLFRATGDITGAANAHYQLARVYRDLNDRPKELEHYMLALPLYRASGDHKNEATTLNNIGGVYSDLGDQQKALDYYVEALTLRRASGDHGGEATTLYNIGAVYYELGEMQKALDYLPQALRLYRTANNRRGEAKTLSEIGAVYSQIGEKQKALDYFAQSLPLLSAVGDRESEGAALSNIGVIYRHLGQYQKALAYYEQVLPLFRSIHNQRGEANTLDNIGGVYHQLGDRQKALDYFTRALPLRRAAGDRSGEATTLNNIGVIRKSLGEKETALDYYRTALLLHRGSGDRQGEAVTLTNLGDAYHDLGQKQKASDHYAQALLINRAIGDRQGEAFQLARVAYIEGASGNFVDASGHIEAAVAIIESLRTKIANQELRTSFFATSQNYYQFYIDLLMLRHKQNPAAGHDGEALQISERARARALLELLTEANADIRQGVNPALVERQRSLQRRLNARAHQQMKLFQGPHPDATAAASAKEIDDLTTELQQVDTQIRQTSPQYASLTQPRPLSLKEIQTQVLDPNTLLLEYSLGPDRSYLWAVTPTSITSYELPDGKKIEASASRVYRLLNARNERVKGETPAQRVARVAQADSEISAATANLSRMVLAPVAQQLGTKRLAIVADGVLQSIPFAILTAPGAAASTAQPLVVEHEIVSLPSASTLSVIRAEVAGRKPAPKGIAVLADPVFTDSDVRVKRNGQATTTKNRVTPKNETPLPRSPTNAKELQLVEASIDIGLTSEGLSVPRLSGSREEAKAIVAMSLPSENRLALDFEASRATATSAELSQYRYVHFSTHGFLNSVHPELSGIALSLVNERGEAQDGFLRAHEIFNLKLPAELVVLSACQTGIGKSVSGEGLMSLTRGFMYAGAPRVVVSLWSVSELGTTELMVRFYRGMLEKGLRPAAALREAQISLMKEKRWSSPFYWAPFTLQGEWR